MDREFNEKRRPKRAPRPLNREKLEEMALAYVARFATSAAKLERYLKRKLRERGWEDEAEDYPDVSGLVARYVDQRFVDDEAYAQAKSGSLLRRGYGARRVAQALGEAGIAENLREEVAPDEAQRRRAALALARKRRFGPFHQNWRDGDDDEDEAPALDRAVREKQIAAMLRAGHSLDMARTVIEAKRAEDVEQWVAEAEEEAE
ncbi:regulatory protein RecX [Altericroceibacterium endophyticum]|uniref:Regulatory protein RecX n=1 Tax=Altericroceibacterium endophyticum TaxID=1808508 RepID=A0A6I4T323_9SPHN|nr:RecX family transcriptional regulator [Altericroceibacterium endophyticum]MXO65266.1 hypothetical protein [Altericroceibacterium endophyticum]